MKNIKLYSPINLTAYEEDNQYPIPINNLGYAKEVSEAIQLIDTAAGDRGLMAFFDKDKSSTVNNKIGSIRLSVIERVSSLYCVTTINFLVTNPLILMK